MGGEVYRGGCRGDAVVEHREQDGVCTAATASVHTDAATVHILAVVPHIVEQHLRVERLYHMGTVCLVRPFPVFVFALPPTIEVEVDTDGTHARQGSESLLFVGTVASAAEVAVRADDERMLAP